MEIRFAPHTTTALISCLNPSAIIFDWSGTLVDDLPPVLDATNAVLVHAGKPPLSREGFRRTFRLPYTKFYEEMTPHVPMHELEAVFRRAFKESREAVTLLPHAREFVEYAASRRLRLFVLSSAPQDAVEEQARTFGLHGYMERIHADVPDKSAVIHELLAHHGIEPDRTLYVGDMVHDIDTARAADIFSVAVLTGYDYAETLEAAAPRLILPHLGRLQDWMEEQFPAILT